jgi:hypothetical protein
LNLREPVGIGAVFQNDFLAEFGHGTEFRHIDKPQGAQTDDPVKGQIARVYAEDQEFILGQTSKLRFKLFLQDRI